jgi:hypothetical protein
VPLPNCFFDGNIYFWRELDLKPLLPEIDFREKREKHMISQLKPYLKIFWMMMDDVEHSVTMCGMVTNGQRNSLNVGIVMT